MFYFMENKYFGRRDVILPAEINTHYSEQCPNCGSYRNIAQSPVNFVMRGAPCDYYISCGYIFISRTFKNLLEQLDIRGFETRPAKVLEWNMSDAENEINSLSYYEMIVKASCGPMRDLNNTILPTKCEVCMIRKPLKEKVDGVSFDPSQYDGSDLFVFDNQRNIPIVTEKLKKELIKNKITNLRFTDINKRGFS